MYIDRPSFHRCKAGISNVVNSRPSRFEGFKNKNSCGGTTVSEVTNPMYLTHSHTFKYSAPHIYLLAVSNFKNIAEKLQK